MLDLDRYPGLFHFEALHRDADQESFNFFLVPLLKAMAGGSKRRQLASEILAAAIRTASRELDELDWVVGGDYNAELVTGDFEPLRQGGLVPISYGPDDYFIVAAEKTVPNYVKKVRSPPRRRPPEPARSDSGWRTGRTRKCRHSRARLAHRRAS
jgi:hypothetical protein